MKTIVVAGASGFVGHSLVDFLLQKTDYKIIALSRGKKVSHDPRLEWRKTDLFSAYEVTKVVKSADAAIYLVHSMLPSAHLDQGSFENYDYLLADNFARACEKAKVQQLVYLGGIIPDGEELSEHLRSRKEVESLFRQRGFAFTCLRAGLILGVGGSSFNIMYNLVQRLPILLVPSWGQTKMTPVDLGDVIKAIHQVLLAPEHFDKIYDIGGSSTHTYFELMEILAKKLGKKRLFVRFPFSTINLSKYWVKLISGASKELAYPLISSLKISMRLNESRRFQMDQKPKNYEESLDQILTKTPKKMPYTPSSFERRYVRSVQRMWAIPGKDAEWFAREYANWLPKFMFPFIHTVLEKDEIIFCFLSRKLPLLRLLLARDRSTENRCLFLIEDGLLVNKTDTGRLDFLISLDGKFLFAAIHDYYPALPWYIYRFTQAQVHLWVMRGFAKHLKQNLKRHLKEQSAKNQ